MFDAVVRKAGRIFGKHDHREQLRKAAEKALPPHKAATFAAYDVRHGHLTQPRPATCPSRRTSPATSA